MTRWMGGLVEWEEDGFSNISVVFSWQLQAAYGRAIWHKQMGQNVRMGGPAVSIQPTMFDGIAEVGHHADALSHHNADATFTSRGCVRNCPFCIVPRYEGGLVELTEWPAKPIVCDNNILATSRRHFDRVIDCLKPLSGIDFNQGLDARLLTPHHARRLQELDISVVRLAWDHTSIETKFLAAWQMLLDVGFPARLIQSYVLIGFNDTPNDARYRLETIRNLGGRPNPMRFQPLTSTRKNEYVHPEWTERLLRDYMRYWSRQNWLSKVPFDEYLVYPPALGATNDNGQ